MAIDLSSGVFCSTLLEFDEQGQVIRRETRIVPAVEKTATPCRTCDGRGWIRMQVGSEPMTAAPCPVCCGAGRIKEL